MEWWLKSGAKDIWVFQEHENKNIKKKHSLHIIVIQTTTYHTSAEKKKKKIRTSSSPVSPQERQRLGESGGGRRCFAVKPHQRCFEATSSYSLSSGSRTHARTHTPRRRRRFASCGRAHDMKPVTHTHMWWQSDAPSPSSPRPRPPPPPLPPLINQRATCTPESLGSGCLNEDIAAMVKDKAEDRTLQYQQTLVSFGWGHRWRLASCVGAWRDFSFFFFSFFFFFLWMSSRMRLPAAQPCPVWEQEEAVCGLYQVFLHVVFIGCVWASLGCFLPFTLIHRCCVTPRLLPGPTSVIKSYQFRFHQTMSD